MLQRFSFLHSGVSVAVGAGVSVATGPRAGRGIAETLPMATSATGGGRYTDTVGRRHQAKGWTLHVDGIWSRVL